MPFQRKTPEPAPIQNKYPRGQQMKKKSKLKCMGCKNGQTAKGTCGGCQGKGYIEV